VTDAYGGERYRPLSSLSAGHVASEPALPNAGGKGEKEGECKLVFGHLAGQEVSAAAASIWPATAAAFIVVAASVEQMPYFYARKP